MPVLEWDKLVDRTYESGLDRGVLYLPDGSAVPWNGLTSVIESFDKDKNPVYYDGMKINDLVVLGDFSASMKAITYPDEFTELEGMGKIRHGLFVGDQKPQLFGLCYRNQIGNALEGDVTGYKIHIIYNVTAIPKDRTHESISNDPKFVDFEWDLTAVPDEVPGFHPTAHITIDSQNVDPWLLEELEEILYGNSVADASLIPMPDLISLMAEWYRVKIIDNGDGTWTAITKRDGFISFTAPGVFMIEHVNAVYLDEVTFLISDTRDIFDVPEIKIHDNGNGTWSATTEHDDLITINDDGIFEILNANVIMIDADTYRISDTVED